MAAAARTSQASRDVTAELAFLTRALKAPTLRESATRLAERARAESWTHEEFLAACLQREVAASESHGGEGRDRRRSPQPFWSSSSSCGPTHRGPPSSQGSAPGNGDCREPLAPTETCRPGHLRRATWTGDGSPVWGCTTTI